LRSSRIGSTEQNAPAEIDSAKTPKFLPTTFLYNGVNLLLLDFIGSTGGTTTMGRKRKQYGRIPGHTPEPEMAKLRGVEISTLQKERSQRRGPAYIVVNKQVHYVDADFPKWLESLKRVPATRTSRAA
jgi:hypothetical protein